MAIQQAEVVTEATALAWAKQAFGRQWGATWRGYSDNRCCVGFVSQHGGRIDEATRKLRGSGQTWAEALDEAKKATYGGEW